MKVPTTQAEREKIVEHARQVADEEKQRAPAFWDKAAMCAVRNETWDQAARFFDLAADGEAAFPERQRFERMAEYCEKRTKHELIR